MARVVRDTRVFQHLARCAPHRYRCGGQRNRLGHCTCPFQACHLRTVIVTAAVYRGLDSKLRPKTNLSSWPSGTGQASAPIRRLSTSQRPVFLVNSRLGRFTAAISGSRPRRPITLTWRPFSRSYGAILPSSFSRVLPIALVFSTCPPVSVLVRARPTSLDAFLGGMASRTSALAASASCLRLHGERISLSPTLRSYH